MSKRSGRQQLLRTQTPEGPSSDSSRGDLPWLLGDCSFLASFICFYCFSFPIYVYCFPTDTISNLHRSVPLMHNFSWMVAGIPSVGPGESRVRPCVWGWEGCLGGRWLANTDQEWCLLSRSSICLLESDMCQFETSPCDFGQVVESEFLSCW